MVIVDKKTCPKRVDPNLFDRWIKNAKGVADCLGFPKLAKKIEEYRADEESLKMALLNAQKLADKIVAEAKETAEKENAEINAETARLHEIAEKAAAEKADQFPDYVHHAVFGRYDSLLPSDQQSRHPQYRLDHAAARRQSATVYRP